MKPKNNKHHLNALRHSTSHLLAAAVLDLYPDAKPAFGPPTQDGFYYDFEFSQPISEKDLPKIEKKMKNIVKNWKTFTRYELTKKQADKKVGENPYKKELIREHSENGKKKVSFYKSGNFWDLCKGGHVKNPQKEIKYFKLLSVAGAYWRGNEKNPMLTRIYGTAFDSKEKLDTFLWKLKEAKERDHRKLGRKLNLFVFSEKIGQGLPLYTPKGALVRKLLQEHVNKLQKKIGYQEVWTPQITRSELFKTSGHYEKYKDDMFRVVSNYSNEEYFLKPMNCPNHCILFASEKRSYRDLPIRYADFANLYRDEKPGELLGLTRLRFFSQDDGHCFCREDQIEEEFSNVSSVISSALKPFSISYWIRLSLWDPKHPEKYLGDKSVWEKAQKRLENILKHQDVKYKKVEGEAAIYGPKMDFIAVDALGREWQISTIQLDMIMPVRFGLVYTDKDGKDKNPYMIHRAILGSPERFMGLLIEHYKGAFPLWLSPVQIVIIPITDTHKNYAYHTASCLENVRVSVDDRNKSMQSRIRDASLQKIPYIGIIGDKEMKNHKITVRTREGKDLGSFSIDAFSKKILKEIEKKI